MNGLPNTIDEVNNLDLNYIKEWEREMIKDGMRAIVRTNNVLKERENLVNDTVSKPAHFNSILKIPWVILTSGAKVVSVSGLKNLSAD